MKNVYFIRHTSNWGTNNSGQLIVDWLFDNSYVAVHFDNIKSWNPDDYVEKFGNTAIRYFNTLNSSSGEHVVVAYYAGSNIILIGEPEPNSKRFYDDLMKSNNNSLKLLKLKNIQKVSIGEFPLPFLLAPLKGTLVEWHQGKVPVNAYLGNIQYDLMNPTFYSPFHLEIIVEEWLRRKDLLFRKLFKTGGYLKDIDIFGVDSNYKTILVQVKYHSSEKQFKQFNKISEYFPNSQAYFFSEDVLPINQNFKFTHIRLSDVLKDLKQIDGDDQYFEKMLFNK